MKIKTKYFTLRSSRRGDEISLWDSYNDKEVAKSMVTTVSENKFKKDFREGLRKKSKNADRFIIEVDKRAVGKVKIRFFDPFNKTKAKNLLLDWKR